MKRWKKAAVGLLLIPLMVIGGLAVWQKDNLVAMYNFMVKDSASLEQELEASQQEQQNKLEEQYQVTVKPPSAQNSNDLIDGVVMPEDVKSELGITDVLEGGGSAEVEKPIAPEKEPAGKPTQQKPSQSEAPAKPEEPADKVEMTQEERSAQINALVERCTAELYACEVDLMGRLGAMKKAAVDEWTALPEEERTTDKKMEIGMAGLQKCYDLEVEIDKTVQAILISYEEPLSELGSDFTVLDELWEYYLDKKSTQKAYYLNKYLG